MSSKRIYNMVLKATDVCPEGELLTDKELEKIKLNNVKRDWPETSKGKSLRRRRLFQLWSEICNSYSRSNTREQFRILSMRTEFNYMLLDRLRCDCEYYLGYGGRDANHCLWAHDEQKQIDKMRELYDKLPVKPEWLTAEQINEYAAKMGVK